MAGLLCPKTRVCPNFLTLGWCGRDGGSGVHLCHDPKRSSPPETTLAPQSRGEGQSAKRLITIRCGSEERTTGQRRCECPVKVAGTLTIHIPWHSYARSLLRRYQISWSRVVSFQTPILNFADCAGGVRYPNVPFDMPFRCI